MIVITLAATLEMDKDGTWYYIQVPKEIWNSLKEFEHRGSIKSNCYAWRFDVGW